ncbi:MAG: tRNA (guanosine(37)-N1)-methyltransferase TrmD [Syntrophomonadaceae bacterium]|jgi:tRNA (guanine37-N1)-methyltransferase|nr:tRNA (guanosine(37)-N1)-methyltransferase TrmD [Syntrophomonadaceae bacterium]
MKIQVFTLFPEMFDGPVNTSIIKRAREKGAVDLELVNIRDFAHDRHAQTDDYPYGGGAGMVLKADVVIPALAAFKNNGSHVVYMSPQGKTLNQKKAAALAAKPHLIILCGHYEGIDERIMTQVDEEISIGDYILTGGEIPALVVIDAVSRLLPGVLGCPESLREESFSGDLLGYPQYTRPPLFQALEVPPPLLSGNHEHIRLWRKKQSLLKTLLKRPELLLQKQYSAEEKGLLIELLFSGEKMM